MESQKQQKKEVLVLIAQGTEEIEALTVVDVLRRAGAAVTVATVEDALATTLAHGVVVVADRRASDIAAAAATTAAPFALVVVPGGMPGSARVRDSPSAAALLRAQAAAAAPLAAICAAPAVVFAPLGLLAGVARAACYPHADFAAALETRYDAEARVVVAAAEGEGRVTVTSVGPGSALEFALRLAELLFGRDAAKKLADAMVVHPAVAKELFP